MDKIWPPDYTLRFSKRAKHVALRVLPHKGLEVIYPCRFKDADPLKYINAHRLWVEKQLARINRSAKNLLPDIIELPAINEVWHVAYTTEAGKREKIIVTEDKRLIVYNSKSNIYRHKGLNDWLLTKALTHLPGWLSMLSNRTGLNYRELIVRAQKTIWGSCSADNKISLNCRLLFLKPHLVEYVMVHELCHIKFHDHSARFWHLVDKFLPNCKYLRKELRQAEDKICLRDIANNKL